MSTSLTTTSVLFLPWYVPSLPPSFPPPSLPSLFALPSSQSHLLFPSLRSSLPQIRGWREILIGSNVLGPMPFGFVQLSSYTNGPDEKVRVLPPSLLPSFPHKH